jgi:hypothetical protein
MTSIFTSWEPKHTELWGNQPIRLSHRLHEHPLFSREALAQLIESYPPKAYMLVAMGAQGEEKLWREGEIGSLSGEQVIDSIAAGRMWLNLIRVNGDRPALRRAARRHLRRDRAARPRLHHLPPHQRHPHLLTGSAGLLPF